MGSSESKKPKRKKKSTIVASVIAGLLFLLALMLRSCGLGTGDDDSSATPDAQTIQGTVEDAGQPPGIDARVAPAVCIVRIDSKGISVDGNPAEIADAVRICRRAGRVSLDATGGARRGTYNELIRALDEAGIRGVPSPKGP